MAQYEYLPIYKKAMDLAIYNYWSSSTYAANTSNAGNVNMNDGNETDLYLGRIKERLPFMKMMKKEERKMVRKIFCIVLFAVMSSALAYAAPADIPKTGQTTSYGTGSIDDGALQKGVAWPSPRFTVGAGTEVACVTDDLTGLMWVKAPDSTIRTWQVALDYADGLDLCGHTDWRLPNVNELESLVNAEQSNPSTWLNTQGFSNVWADNYWSSSTYALNTTYAWFVNMVDGYVLAGVTTSLFVWPVRSGQ